MQKVFTNKFAEAFEVNPLIAPNTLLVRWKGFWILDEEEEKYNLHKALSFSLNFIKRKEIKILISDCRNLETLGEDITLCLEDKWYPVAYEDGLEMEIYLDASDAVSQISLGFLFEQVEEKVPITIEKAKGLEEALRVAQKFYNKKQATISRS